MFRHRRLRARQCKTAHNTTLRGGRRVGIEAAINATSETSQERLNGAATYNFPGRRMRARRQTCSSMKLKAHKYKEKYERTLPSSLLLNKIHKGAMVPTQEKSAR